MLLLIPRRPSQVPAPSSPNGCAGFALLPPLPSLASLLASRMKHTPLQCCSSNSKAGTQLETPQPSSLLTLPHTLPTVVQLQFIGYLLLLCFWFYGEMALCFLFER